MDPNLQQKDSQDTSGQQSPGQFQSAPSPSSSGGMRVIQPLSTDIKPEPVSPQLPIQPVPSPSSEVQAVPVQADRLAPNVAALEPARFDPSLIYPVATKGINSNGRADPSMTPVDNVSTGLKTVAYAEGYVLGGTIFMYQFIAGIVVGLLSPHLQQTFAHTPAVLAVLYVIGYLILLYLPYRVLRSNAVEEPLWLTLIGVVAQTVVIALGYALVAIIVKAAGSLGIFGIAIGIGFLVASYFLTKLAWGLAFSLVDKIKNKLIVKTIGIGLVAIFVGLIAYHFVTVHNPVVGGQTNTATQSIQPSGLTAYHVTGNPSYSVKFYKDAKISNPGSGYLAYGTGRGVQGVSLNIANAITINAQSTCSPGVNNSEFTFQSQGSNGIVCVVKKNTLTSYIGQIQISGKSYTIYMFSYSSQQNLPTVKAIFNSVVIF